jgi:hypothetical protein
MGGGHKKHSVLDWSTELLYTTYNKTWHITIKTVSQMGYTVMFDICEETEHVHKHIKHNTIEANVKEKWISWVIKSTVGDIQVLHKVLLEWFKNEHLS